MCSIAGGVWLVERDAPHRSVIEERIAAALETLKARGPDASAVTAVSNGCVMGGNRLIVRSNPHDDSMPLREGPNRAFFNGEIYNYRRWAPDSSYDGHAILTAYAKHGMRCFAEFDGEFAIAIWDDRSGSLILARDPFGAKPLYFSYDGRRLLWASSATAINRIEAHPFCAAVKSSVYHYTRMPQEPYTSFAGVWLVPPGHVLIVRDGRVTLGAYNRWDAAPANSHDTRETFEALERTLSQRMDYTGTLGIPMSGGIDSGIIAFAADRLGVAYHVFSVIAMDGRPTVETPIIEERLKRLRQPRAITRLECNQAEYDRALETIYLPDYYSCENFDTGAIPTHTVFSAMRDAGIRVALDGAGGDEIFHGYAFRDDFAPVDGWPTPWTQERYYYSIITSLLSWTAKVDRAGGHFSIESRFPFLSPPLMRAAMQLRPHQILKWPLRQFLLERFEYGPPMPADLGAKFGFTLPRELQSRAIADMQRRWCEQNGLLGLPTEAPKAFPFTIGATLAELCDVD